MPDEPKNLDEFQAALSAIADKEGTLTPEEVEQYTKLEQDMVTFKASQDVKSRNQVWNKPRVSLQPASVIKGSRDDGRYTYDKFLRGDQGAAKELADFPDGGKTLRWPLSQGMVDMKAYAQTETTTAGGYLVPTVTEPVLVKITKAFGGLSARSMHLNTNNGAPINFPSIDDTANTSAIAAINAAPGAGGADLAFTQITLGAYK